MPKSTDPRDQPRPEAIARASREESMRNLRCAIALIEPAAPPEVNPSLPEYMAREALRMDARDIVRQLCDLYGGIAVARWALVHDLAQLTEGRRS